MKIAKIYENDDEADNDVKIGALYADAGNWYTQAQDFEKAIAALNSASEANPSDTKVLLARLQTYYFYGKKLQEQSADTTDPVEKQNLMDQARDQFTRGVQVGNALTSLDFTNAQGFQFLALCQVALGDQAAAEQNLSTYRELTGGS